VGGGGESCFEQIWSICVYRPGIVLKQITDYSVFR
jgi:hypothetical protein